MALCKVILIGNLGRDPETRYTQAGKMFTRFTVACNRVSPGPDGERREETEWFNCTAWGRLAEVSQQYLHKGSRVYIEGRLSTRQYDGQDGQRRTSLDVVVSELQMLEPRPRGEMPEAVPAPADEPSELDNVPF